MFVCGCAAARAEALDAILARMDSAARQFHSLSAHIQRTDYTVAIQDSETMRGSVRMRQGKNVTVVIDFTEPDPYTIFINGRTVQIYHPKAIAVEKYDATKFTSVMDQYLLLGFGTTAAELNKAYNVKLGGTETAGGATTTRLDLTPKSVEALKYVSKIELWIPEGQTNPVQEKITKSSKDTILVSYADVQINPPLPESAFELKLPAGVRTLTPQK